MSCHWRTGGQCWMPGHQCLPGFWQEEMSLLPGPQRSLPGVPGT